MSYIAPIVPDNSPFSPAQRAWLNGLLAGLLGTDAAAAAIAGMEATLAPQAQLAPQAAPAQPEEFPWHDAALPLDERMKLADGRPLERRMMAAMGQLDCGQCGYLCQTYAEAIARGEEKSLTRCVPGGKETAHMLKELIAAPPGSGPAATAAASPPKTQAASAALTRAQAEWIDRIRAKIKSNIILPPDIAGNPEARFDVVQLPTGEVIDVRLAKSSGVRAYDDAVQRAILKSSPLPRPAQAELFVRTLELRFRPQE